MSSSGPAFYDARYYDPALGRFIQADTIVPNLADPQDLNRYSYVRNNPLRYTDPSGHWYYDPGCDCLVSTGVSDSGVNDWPSNFNQAPGQDVPNMQGLYVPYDGGAAYCAYADCDYDLHTGGLALVAAIVFEPVDWALTFYQWANGDFSAWDLLGLLPLLSGRMDAAADGVLGFAKHDSFFDFGWKGVRESSQASKQVDKLRGVVRQNYDDVVKKLANGDLRGLDLHPLKGSRQGQFAVNLPGLGKGRGKGRVIISGPSSRASPTGPPPSCWPMNCSSPSDNTNFELPDAIPCHETGSFLCS